MGWEGEANGPGIEWAGHCGKEVLGPSILGPVDWIRAENRSMRGPVRRSLPRGAGATRPTLTLDARSEMRRGSGLSHHATGFGVSLGKEPWASKVSSASPSTLYLVSHPQKLMGIHLFSRVLSGRSKHRFPPNFYFPYKGPRQSPTIATHLYGLEDPLPEVSDFGVHSRLPGQSTARTPAYNAT